MRAISALSGRITGAAITIRRTSNDRWDLQITAVRVPEMRAQPVRVRATPLCAKSVGLRLG